MVRRPVTAAFLVAWTGLVSCSGSKGEDSNPVGDGGGGSDSGAPEPCWGGEDVFNIHYWSNAGLEICITGFDDTQTYRFGMLGVQLGDKEAWTGEDCVRGATLEDGTFVDHCHPLVAAFSAYQGGVDPEVLDPATQTSFEAEDQHQITYILFQDGTDDCWVWGFDTSIYYYSLGVECTDI